MAKPLRVFISSPGDVVPERRRTALVIEKLAKDYSRFFEIKPYLWETEPMLASGHFQDAILPPGDTDILVLILWSRLGTPLPEPKYRGIDGRTPVTGTEWEFETALAAHQQSGVPDLLAYRKKASPRAEYKSDADLEELRRQLQKFEAFWSRNFVDRGEFRTAFGEFENLDGFEAKLEGDLRRLIERRIATLRGETDKAASPTWLMGSPFRGLESYRFEHAPIFFGRSEVTKTAVEYLVQNAEARRPFLLVLGASGSGKSSLAQAGIVPALGVSGVLAGVGNWRRAVMRPGGHPGGLFMALATAVVGDDALPELLKGQDVAALARHLEVAAADPSFPIVSALTAREQAARQKGDFLSFEEVRLVLVVDQLEELFTLGEVTPDQRKAFILCLKGLMDSRRVFVIATMRGDYWHRAAEMPLLVALSEGRGRLDLLAPTQAEITEMIRRPAEVAGLSFETDPRTEIRLDAALAEEAAREPGALPLLSFLLDALYAKDVQESAGSTLRYASVRALGGLKGAIATRAETAFTALPADAQAALPKVLRALVTVSRSGAEPTTRAVPMARFAEGSPERRVVEAFLDPQVRLLVADGDGNGARVRLAHEALITHWERARRQIAQDRDDLRTRAVIEEALTEWHAAEGRNRRGYLLRDPHLANAVDLTKRWGDELDAPTRDFIDRSARSARLVQTLTVAAAVVFALVAGAAFYAERQAVRAQKEAEDQRQHAQAGLAAATQLANSLVFGTMVEFRRRGLAQEAGQMSEPVIQSYDQVIDRVIRGYDQVVKIDPTAEAYNGRGAAYADKGDLDHAIADFSQAIALDPKNAVFYDDRGDAYRDKNDDDHAIADFDQAITLDPKNAMAYKGRGAAYYDKSDLARAIADFDQAITLDPNYTAAYVNRGVAYRAKGDLDHAIADDSRAIALDPKYAFAYGDRGLAYFDKGDRDQAIADYDQAIALDPKYAIAYRDRGLAYFDKGDRDQAIADYDQAIILDPRYAEAFNNRGDAYYDKGDLDHAIADYSQAITLDPKYAEAFDSRGDAYKGKGDLDHAIADYGQAIVLDPTHAEAFYNRGRTYYDKHDLRHAIADYDQAIMLDPTLAGAFYNRGRAYQDDGDLDHAIADYGHSIILDSTFADVFNNRGRAYHDKHDLDHAIADYDQAIALDPSDENPFFNRGVAYDDKGDLDHAIADFSQAINLDPTDAAAYNGRCWAQVVVGRQLQQALSDCNESLRIRPNNAETLDSRGFAYLQLGQLDNAIADFSTALAINPKFASSLYGRGLAKLRKGDRAGADADMAAAKAIKTDITEQLAGYGIK